MVCAGKSQGVWNPLMRLYSYAGIQKVAKAIFHSGYNRSCSMYPLGEFCLTYGMAESVEEAYDVEKFANR